MHARLFASLFCLSVLGLSSCGGDDPPGSLVVPFEIGAGVACSTLGVTEVTVTLMTMSASGAVPEEIASEVVPCDDKQAEFNGLAAGRYEVVATGVDMAGVIVVDNAGKDKPDSAEVTSGAQNTADVVNMSATPAQIHVRWTLNGGFGQCTDVPAASFVVGAYDNGGASLLHEYAFDCDPEEAPVDGYNVVVDEGRDVEGDEIELITIDPVDAMGKSIVATKLNFAMTPPGHGRIIKLTAALDCTADPCTIACPNNDGMGNCLPD
jgi:hypothetical protein